MTDELRIAKHRLFLGCPIPADATAQITEWCQRQLGGLDVRVVPPQNLHVTMIFFGQVTTATRDKLIELTAQASWVAVPAKLGALAMAGRAALTLQLEVAKQEIEALEDRLGRSSAVTPQGLSAAEREAWSRRLWNEDDPIYQMRWYIPAVENVKMARRQRVGRPLQLHLTIGRIATALPPAVLELRPPEVAFALDRLTLFESFLEPTGSRYVALATAKRET